MRYRFRCYALLLMSGLVCAARLPAAPSTLDIEQLAGDGWRAEALSLAIELGAASGPQVTLTVADISLDALALDLHTLRIRCAAVDLNRRGIACADARYSVRVGTVEHSGRAQLRYRAATQRLDVEIPNLGLPGGRLTVRVSADADGIRATVGATGFAAPELLALVSHWLPEAAGVEISAGALDLEVTLSSGDLLAVRGTARFTDLAFNDESGRYAGEALAARIEVDAARAAPAAAWRGRLAVNLEQGGAYAEPVYLDLARYPLQLASEFVFEPVSADLNLVHFELEQAGILSASGSAHSTSAQRLAHLAVEVSQARFPAIYDAYLAGALVGTPLASLDTSGMLSGRAEFGDGKPRVLDIELDAVHIEDRDGRFALYGLDGAVHWAAMAADISSSQLELAGGFLFGAGFDAVSVELGIAGQAIDLLEPARVSLLGGALVIKTFSVRDYGSDDLALGFEAELEPIELGQLTTALEWPVFSGTLAGRLPLLTYKKGVVTVGGNLEARAFDGEISVERLRIEQPFGIVPRMDFSVRLRNLDLAQVTEVVPFGQVEGRLDGDIDDLRLLKGEPVQFDAYFRTPEDDDSRHRMSQRAVDTISRVAGGGAVLSTTFLRIFKHFAYDRLGISCRLENDVCHMGGVGDTDDGYYIVKGALIPRVDLIGRVRQVKWSRLMQQLEQALNEGEFTIE